MATLLKVLNNLADIKSAGGVALRVRTQGGPSLFKQRCLCWLQLLCPDDSEILVKLGEEGELATNTALCRAYRGGKRLRPGI